MYSAYLFLAFIFGRTLLMVAAVTITEDSLGPTTTELKFQIDTALTNADDQIGVFSSGADTSTATPITFLKGQQTVGQTITTNTGELQPGTQYDVYIKPNGAAWTDKTTLATLPAVKVDLVSADSTSAKYKWTGIADSGTVSYAIAGGATGTPTTEEIDIEGLTPSTKNTITFKAVKHTEENEKILTLCTAPSKLTVTTEVKAEDNGDNTLTVNIAFGDKDKVSKIDIELGVDISDAGITAECDETTCKDCKTCSGTPTKKTGNKGFEVTTSIADEGPKYSVIISKYPKANLETAFKVTAEFDNGCDDQGTIDNLSFATLANKETMLVYLAIGSMATVLRLLGLEVWTPLGSH